jgi:hypothetical protein
MNVGRYLRGEDRHVGTARTTKGDDPGQWVSEKEYWLDPTPILPEDAKFLERFQQNLDRGHRKPVNVVPPPSDRVTDFYSEPMNSSRCLGEMLAVRHYLASNCINEGVIDTQSVVDLFHLDTHIIRLRNELKGECNE